MKQKAQSIVEQKFSCVIHRYNPHSEELERVQEKRSKNDRSNSENQNWVNEKRSRMRFGVGIAGKSLEIKEPILVPDTFIHPWFNMENQTYPFRSLLVAPLFDVINENQPIGTVSLFGDNQNEFILEDEISLNSISSIILILTTSDCVSGSCCNMELILVYSSDSSSLFESTVVNASAFFSNDTTSNLRFRL